MKVSCKHDLRNIFSKIQIIFLNNLNPIQRSLYKIKILISSIWISFIYSYDKSEKYTFFYNPDQEIETNIEVDENQHKMFEIGYFKQSELSKILLDISIKLFI